MFRTIDGIVICGKLWLHFIVFWWQTFLSVVFKLPCGHDYYSSCLFIIQVGLYPFCFVNLSCQILGTCFCYYFRPSNILFCCLIFNSLFYYFVVVVVQEFWCLATVWHHLYSCNEWYHLSLYSVWKIFLPSVHQVVTDLLSPLTVCFSLMSDKIRNCMVTRCA